MVLGLVLISPLCVCVTKPGLTYESQNQWTKWSNDTVLFWSVHLKFLWNLQSEASSWIYSMLYVLLKGHLFVCILPDDAIFSFQHSQKRRADPDVNPTSLPELVGLPQCVPFGNLGRRKQMPGALWAFHAHAHPALWIEKCSYSINAPFKTLLQQHSSLYCNYTYCISLYSDP